MRNKSAHTRQLCGHFKHGSIELGNLRESFRSRFLRRRVSEKLYVTYFINICQNGRMHF